MALFLRGFNFHNYTEQLKGKQLETPTLDVWLVEVPDYSGKMDAYKNGIAAAKYGYGVVVMSDHGAWTWVAGVYTTENAAKEALNQPGLPPQAKIRSYQISGKKFQIDSEAFEPCHQVLTAVKKVFHLLLDLRMSICQKSNTNNLQLDLTTAYNQIKSSAEILQTLNVTHQSELIATVIYTANQNILGLQDVICLDSSEQTDMATINTALLKAIFSLDNF